MLRDEKFHQKFLGKLICHGYNSIYKELSVVLVKCEFFMAFNGISTKTLLSFKCCPKNTICHLSQSSTPAKLFTFPQISWKFNHFFMLLQWLLRKINKFELKKTFVCWLDTLLFSAPSIRRISWLE